MLENQGQIQFKIRTAGYVFDVKAQYPQTKKLCEKFLVPEDAPADCEIAVTRAIVEELIENAIIEAEKYGLEALDGEKHFDYYEFLALHKLICEWICMHDAIMFHCSSVMVDGEAYLFTAPSGTGKSTHASLWKKLLGERMTYINDDKPFLKRVYAGAAGCSDGDNFALYAYGSPWCGKHFLGENVSAPIKAIGIIVRDEKNFVRRVEPMEAFIILYKQTYLPREQENQMRATVAMMKDLAERIPMYEIHCNMDIEAAEISFAGMSES